MRFLIEIDCSGDYFSNDDGDRYAQVRDILHEVASTMPVTPGMDRHITSPDGIRIGFAGFRNDEPEPTPQDINDDPQADSVRELQKLMGHVYQCLGSDTNRMDKLDARLASLENVYADVRRAQNHLEGLESPAPATAAGDGGWVSPYKRSPDEGQDVLVWRKCWDVEAEKDDYLMVIARYESRDGYPRYHTGHDGEILAWRPLPEPPAKS